MKYLFRFGSIVFISMASFQTEAQQIQNTLTSKDSAYLQTLNQISAFLKTRPTPNITSHQSELYSAEEAFYDTAIVKFFNKEKMLKNFSEETEVFTVEGKMDIIRHYLNSCDQYLDIILKDSILFEPVRFSLPDMVSTDEDDIYFMKNTFKVLLLIEGEKIDVLLCFFDDETNKLLGLSGGFEKNEKVKAFIKRHQMKPNNTLN